jgi:asparagine synthase (glutamine-hydrolysing)
MCGVAGILKLETTPCPALVIENMRDEVSYRGPDDFGAAYFRKAGVVLQNVDRDSSNWVVGLGHRRLSILDLSPLGHQPMSYEGRYWIVYNGEVYNYVELRDELLRAGRFFRSSSDTEVILAAFAEWGTSCFSRFRGMWGLILFDAMRREVIVSRDHIGIKPLYLWKGNGLVAIASEIKQFRSVPGFRSKVDDVAAMEYLQTGYEDPERSFFEGVLPVPAGHWMRISVQDCKDSPPEEYWHPERVRVEVTDPDEAANLFAEKLRQSVRIHLRSDVPVGCALSGGMDSSSIAVLVESQNKGEGPPLRTFTSSFPGELIDESEYADAIVSGIHAQPYKVTPQAERFMEDLSRFVWVHDEPVGSFAMYAGYCIARLTRESGVSVTLHGQGGDEVLSGYWQSYFLHLSKLWKARNWRTMAGHFAGALFDGGNSDLVGQVPLMVRRYMSRSRANGGNRTKPGRKHLEEIMSLDQQAARVYQIRTMFLPRMLKWDDRNSMAFSVEARYPFLDPELIELALSFAPETLYRSGWTKLPLRLGLAKELPEKVRWRRTKFGFETPQEKWLCGPLRPHIEKWLKAERPLWDFIDREKVRGLAEQTWNLNGDIKHIEPGQALFRAMIFDHWSEIYAVDVAAACS